MPVTAHPTSSLLSKQPTLIATIRLRKSSKRAESERGNGPGGSLGKIPLGMSAMLAMTIVHVSEQRMVSETVLH